MARRNKRTEILVEATPTAKSGCRGQDLLRISSEAHGRAQRSQQRQMCRVTESRGETATKFVHRVLSDTAESSRADGVEAERERA